MDPAEGIPGLVVPLFQSSVGANLPVTQIVGMKDEVLGFRECAPPNASIHQITNGTMVETGDPALWIFKDETGRAHLGNAKEMEVMADALLSRAGLMHWPHARLELDRFREPRDVEITQAAFMSIRKEDGNFAALVWRDAEIFAPAFMRDVYRFDQKLFYRLNREPHQVLFLDGVLQIFTDQKFVENLKKVPLVELERTIKPFGDAEIIFRSFEPLKSVKGTSSSWAIFGVGGVACHVVRASPFFGVPYTFGERLREPGIRAEGDAPAGGHSSGVSQFIAVCQSGHGQVEAMVAELDAFPPEEFVTHLVNVRPFSLQRDPPRKATVQSLSKLGQRFNHLWLIAGHRQRLTGSYRNQLSVSNAASTLERNLLSSIIRRPDLFASLEQNTPTPSVNLFGALRLQSEWSLSEAITNLLHTMLCEEAVLRSAKRIVILRPSTEPAQTLSVQLGRRRYPVEIYPDPRPPRSRVLIGWALAVKVGSCSPEEFSELCVGLMAGYQWRFRAEDEEGLLFEDEGEALRLRPEVFEEDFLRLISAPSNYGPYFQLLVTPFPIKESWLQQATDMGWSAVHYSQISNWLREHFKSQRFQDHIG